jgi:hypothetical protein
MEKQKNSDIEIVVTFEGVASAENVPDFEFAFYTELHQSETYICSKTGSNLVNCVIKESPDPANAVCEIKCMIENHNLKLGRLCLLTHIKWPDSDYTDGVRNDMYRQKLDFYINN